MTGNDASLPVRSPPDPDAVEGTADVWGVLLAAGTSSRYGNDNKLLREIRGEPMVRLAARSLVETDLASVVAVVGHEADLVTEAIDELDVQVVENERYESGQATSVSTGVRYAAERGADAVLVALGDMPFVAASSVDALVRAYEANLGNPLAAAVDGVRGNPVLFDEQYFDALEDIEGDVGGRRILLESPDAALVETGDGGVVQDVDEPGDLPRADDESA